MENQRQMSPRTETPPKLTTNFSLSYISICGSSPVSVDELSPKKSPSSSKALLVGSNARPLSESKKFKHPSSSSSKSYISRNNSPVPLSFAPVAPPNRYSEEQAIPRWKTSIPPVMNRSQSSDEPLRSPRRLDTLGPHRSSTNSHNTQATQSVSGLSSNFAQAVASMRQQSPNTQTETETMTAEKEKEKSVSINAQERKEKSKSDDEVQDLRKHFKKSSSHATLEGAKQIHKFAANEEPLPNLVSPETLCSASIIGIEERCEIFGGENSATAAMFMAYVVFVQSGGHQWVVYRRYSQFADIRKVVKKAFALVPPFCPKCKGIDFVDKGDKEFVLSKVKGLNEFLTFITIHKPIFNHRKVQHFLAPMQLGDKKNIENLKLPGLPQMRT